MEFNKLRHWILTNCFTKNGDKINSAFLRWCNDDELKEIKKITNDISTAPIGFRLIKFLSKDINFNKCINCNKVIDPKKPKQLYCSLKCSCDEHRTQKIKSTKITKYGSENYRNDDKIKQTCQLKFGGVSPFHSNSIQKQCKESIKKLYNVDNISQYQGVKDKKLTKIKNRSSKQKKTIKQKFLLTYVNKMNIEHTFANKEWLYNEYITKQKTIVDISNEQHISFKCVYDWLLRHNITCNKHYFSSAELKLYNFLLSYNIKVIQSDRKMINPYELDLYLPDYNIAIEYNGLYWHSEQQGKGKNYHLNKTLKCQEQDIQLIHIFEDEWLEKEEIVKSVILSKLGIFQRRLYARKCYIQEIDSKTKNNFLNKYHLQGKDNSSIKLGLYHNNELLSVMTFGKRTIGGTKSVNFEMIRFCNKKNVQIIGGASKLFKYFINNYKYICIKTFADLRYSNGKFYKKLGFKFKHLSSPNYWYIINDKRIHRMKYQKHKLSNILQYFNPTLTEYQNMINNNYDRIWDCGNYVFEYK